MSFLTLSNEVWKILSNHFNQFSLCILNQKRMNENQIRRTELVHFTMKRPLQKRNSILCMNK